MFKNLNHYKAYFAFILITSVISFSGSFNTDATNYFAAPNPSLVDTFTIQANPGPANNGGSPGWAMFLDLIAGPNHDVVVTQMTTASTATANASFSVEVYTRTGTALGGPVGSGPGSSTVGWTLLDTVLVVQGATSSGISLIFDLPPILVTAGDTVGVALRFLGVGPRYYGTGSPAYSFYSDSNLTLITGDGRSAPFTPTGSWFASRALTGLIRYILSPISAVGNNGSKSPNSFKLSQNYPNPFNPTTKISFRIPKNGFVTLKVYDITGKEVAVLVNESLSPGTYETTFDASQFTSGVYFYRLSTKDFSETKKMLLIK